MRTLLTTKTCSCVEQEKPAVRPRQLQKLPVTQRQKITVTSHWCRRNDSSNINGILQPDADLNSPRKMLDNNYQKTSNKTKGVYKKTILSNNNCYCRYKPNKTIKTAKPTKPTKQKRTFKPKKCFPVDESDDEFSSCYTDTYEPTKACSEAPTHLTKHYNSINSQYCKEIPEYTKHSNASVYSQYLNKKYSDESDRYSDDSSSSCAQQRKDYEAYREIQDAYYAHMARYLSDKEMAEKGQIRDSCETITGSKSCESENGSYCVSQEPLPSIEDLRRFRDEHYFETHNVDVAPDIPCHTCEHQYQLDERLLPEPINVDDFGLSCCTVCNQPMKSEVTSESSSIKNLCKYYKYGLCPRKISVGGEKSKIRLKVREEDFERYSSFMGKCRRPEFVNTLALRQQKMMC